MILRTLLIVGLAGTATACTTIEPEGAPPFKANTAPGTFNTPRTERKTVEPPVEAEPEAEATEETEDAAESAS